MMNLLTLAINVEFIIVEVDCASNLKLENVLFAKNLCVHSIGRADLESLFSILLKHLGHQKISTINGIMKMFVKIVEQNDKI